MTLSIEHARSIAAELAEAPIPNFISQAKAKQLLDEVHESPENFPLFTEGLDDRTTFIAYRMLSAGCSLAEQQQREEGHSLLYSAGDLLESTHRANAANSVVSGYHCLIGAMSFYACGHYSRAFVLMRTTSTVSLAAAIVASYLRKDFSELIMGLNDMFLDEQEANDQDQIEADSRALELLVARAIALVFEHSISGDSELLTAADGILDDAMIISEAGANPGFWWIARILRLMLDDYSQGSLWTALPPFFQPGGVSEISDYAATLALSTPPVTELWRSQLAAIELALDEKNRGGVINLRTSSGKTRVAELSILKELRAHPQARILYLAPFRSLAFELERSFVKSLGNLGYSISHLYGGSRFSGVDREMVLEANLLIATPEKVKAMLRVAPELFDGVRLIVVDEGHLLGESERDVKNELFLEQLRIRSRKAGVRMLLLSAVLPNATELAEWIGGDGNAIARSSWKPSDERFGTLRWNKTNVQIEWRGESRCFNPDFVRFRKVVEPGKKRGRKFPKSKTEAVAATAARLSEVGPVLIFAGQARWVSSMAKSVMLAFQDDSAAHDWPEKEWRTFEAVCLEELGPDCIELEAAKLGIICHSNKLPPQVRLAIEKLMSTGCPRVIVATTTLGQGVNIGISSVIVSQTMIGQNVRITKRDFWNICGRAGRAYVDSEGKILFAIDGTKPAWQIQNELKLADAYLDELNVDAVQSGLLQVVALMKEIATGAGISFDVFLELVANSNYVTLGEYAEHVRFLTDLMDDQLLSFHVDYKGIDAGGEYIDWIEAAFQESLAVIQANAIGNEEKDFVFSFLRARTKAIVAEVSDASARRAIISSGLPLSVGKLAYYDLDFFRECADEYVKSAGGLDDVASLVSKLEIWARDNASSMCGSIASKETLDIVRTQWLSGVGLFAIEEKGGSDTLRVCRDFYGYELSWLFHAIAQNYDPEAEKETVAVLELVSLLLELGLPNQKSSRVFLAGIRSRSAAIELGHYVVDPNVSPKNLRDALLDPEVVARLKKRISVETANWLDLFASDQEIGGEDVPSFPPLALEIPPAFQTLHVRKLDADETIFLSSTDGRFSVPAKSTKDLPLHLVANDPRFAFVRTEDGWQLDCRDIRMRSQTRSIEGVFS